MIDKRKSRRFRVLKGATVAFAGSSFACTVRNLSADGAALIFPNSVSVPSSFMLVIEADQFIRRCRPVWTHETRLGVCFH